MMVPVQQQMEVVPQYPAEQQVTLTAGQPVMMPVVEENAPFAHGGPVSDDAKPSITQHI